jgi:predicted methyltransferase
VKGWAFVEFVPKKVVVLDCCSAREILRRSLESSFFTVLANLGLKGVEVRVEGSRALVNGFTVDLESLKAVAEDEEGVYSLSENGLSKLVVAGEHFYRLRRVADNTAPTLEIDGIHMHRIEGTTPWEDAKKKVSLAKVRPSHRVLDTCMGLGYTAIHSALAGAEVLTVEVDPNVVELASYNPWSWRLSDPRIKVVLGDVREVVEDLEDEAFDRVIHDPPRFSPRTGDLYGKKLYSELYRVLKDGGVLFHYVGSPGRARGLDLIRGVAKRLAEVGFDVRVLRSAEAVLAFKD